MKMKSHWYCNSYIGNSVDKLGKNLLLEINKEWEAICGKTGFERKKANCI